MENVDPNLKWYTHISHEKLVRPRCPFASVHRCPRFYESLSLLGDAGSTKIKPKEDQKLLRQWKKSDLWPSTDEQATSIMGRSGKPSIYSNFCPEVAYDRFGIFAVSFAHYAGEIDLGIAHAELGKMQAPINDWRWAWSYVTPMHYTECPLYSPLDLDVSRRSLKSAEQGAPGDVQQAVFRTVWNWNPFLRNVALAMLIFMGIVYLIWTTLPEKTKERLLDVIFH